jgi:hypothetical protein
MGAPHKREGKTIKTYVGGRFTCEICGRNYSLTALDEHHKVPQEIGGPDTEDNIASLCNGCHQTLHRIAFDLVSLSKKKTRSAQEEATDYITSLQVEDVGTSVAKLLELAVYLAQAKTLKKDKAIADLDGDVTIELPQRYKALLIQAGREVKDGAGKRLGMKGIVTLAALDYLKKRHPELKKEIEDYVFKGIVYAARSKVDIEAAASGYEFESVQL